MSVVVLTYEKKVALKRLRSTLLGVFGPQMNQWMKIPSGENLIRCVPWDIWTLNSISWLKVKKCPWKNIRAYMFTYFFYLEEWSKKAREKCEPLIKKWCRTKTSSISRLTRKRPGRFDIWVYQSLCFVGTRTRKDRAVQIRVYQSSYSVWYVFIIYLPME